MSGKARWKSIVAGAACIIAAASGALAENFNIPAGDLSAALDTYTMQTGISLVVSAEAVKGARTKGVHGDLSASDALLRILAGTGFVGRQAANGVALVRDGRTSDASGDLLPRHVATASAPSISGAALETVTVTSSKIGGDVQNIPISITALSQEQLTATQTTGGPDLIKQVPNMTFTKTNFSGYSIQLRGIGTQAISVTTDPAVAVAFNDVPFIRNHFFEQEFYDVAQVEVLRGPQGTLYGRNATAGVVNLASAKPTDQFEAMASADIGNYGNRRLEGMINIPIVDDGLDIRVAGEWTKHQGYSFNETTDQRIDGRDLWSGRVTIGWKPIENLQAYLIWEHFSEDDDRLRSSKQLCKNDPIPTEVDGHPITPDEGSVLITGTGYLSQGCQATSLYSPDAFEVVNGNSLPYVLALQGNLDLSTIIDPYASLTQSRNLRVIESALEPAYRAKNDVVELNADYNIVPDLTFSSQTGFNHDFLWSTEDYNRVDSSPGLFQGGDVQGNQNGQVSLDGVFCDPQLGCSDRLVAEDVSDEHAWQLSQEFRLASHFDGPFNFSIGGNYLHYETEENYYVFFNSLTLFVSSDALGNRSTLVGPWVPGVSDNHECLPNGFRYNNSGQPPTIGCGYIDPNPLTQLNNDGHNYFLSQNPYVLNSYATFGETYYNVTRDVKLTAGLRWTEDQKHFTDIPSELLMEGWGYPSTGVVNQQWDQVTGRSNITWTPKLDFTDQTLLYGSYSHGYKAGGANPPGALLPNFTSGVLQPVHPATFKPEFVDAFEMGTKNTLLDGALTLNGSLFYYNYENYQISYIVDRTSVNLNFDAHIHGAELESTWEPIPGLRLNFSGGWEATAIAKGQSAIDLMDRADLANHPDWMVMKPFVTYASNCVFPTYVVAAMDERNVIGLGTHDRGDCNEAYDAGNDPVTGEPYVPNPVLISGSAPGYIGFDPSTAPNGGEGFAKDLSGNELPNAPRFTVSLGGQYTIPLTTDWAGTLRGDFYWQDASWARVWNDNPYDRLRGYANLNLTVILTSQAGWQVMLYDKNVFNTTAITGTFLNSDDSGLTTNIFLTDPKLIGIRVTKNW